MTSPERREQLRAVADAERAKFDELAVVTSAESVVLSSRIAELAALRGAAYRRVSAARGRLTSARKSGDAAKIAEAEQRLRDRYAEADQIADAGIREGHHLVSHGLTNTGALIDQMRRTWDAADALLDQVLARDPSNAVTDQARR